MSGITFLNFKVRKQICIRRTIEASFISYNYRLKYDQCLKNAFLMINNMAKKNAPVVFQKKNWINFKRFSEIKSDFKVPQWTAVRCFSIVVSQILGDLLNNRYLRLFLCLLKCLPFLSTHQHVVFQIFYTYRMYSYNKILHVVIL